jgi:hypothetical protein
MNPGKEKVKDAEELKLDLANINQEFNLKIEPNDPYVIDDQTSNMFEKKSTA